MEGVMRLWRTEVRITTVSIWGMYWNFVLSVMFHYIPIDLLYLCHSQDASAWYISPLRFNYLVTNSHDKGAIDRFLEA